jgi:hypothetical protein
MSQVIFTLSDIEDMMRQAKSFAWRLAMEGGPGGSAVALHSFKAESETAEAESLQVLRSMVERVARREAKAVFIIDYKANSKHTDSMMSGPFRFTYEDVGMQGLGNMPGADLLPQRIEALGYIPAERVNAMEARLADKLEAHKRELDFARRMDKVKDLERELRESKAKYDEKSAYVGNGIGLAIQAFMSGQGIKGLQGMLGSAMGAPQKPAEKFHNEPDPNSTEGRLQQLAEQILDHNPSPEELAILQRALPKVLQEIRSPRNYGIQTQPITQNQDGAGTGYDSGNAE